MLFDDFVAKAQQFFPNLKIAYKNESPLMKIISYILFFDPNFMTSFITTIGSTVYYPDQSFIKNHPVSSEVTLVHELVHINDSKQKSQIVFSLMYLFPQFLFVIFLPLIFLSLPIFLPLTVLSILPWPAYFRKEFEKRAYIVELYAMNKLNISNNYGIDLDAQKNLMIGYLKGSDYYFVWPFGNGLNNDFNNALTMIKNGQRPFDSNIFDIVDQII